MYLLEIPNNGHLLVETDYKWSDVAPSHIYIVTSLSPSGLLIGRKLRDKLPHVQPASDSDRGIDRYTQRKLTEKRPCLAVFKIKISIKFETKNISVLRTTP